MPVQRLEDLRTVLVTLRESGAGDEQNLGTQRTKVSTATATNTKAR